MAIIKKDKITNIGLDVKKRESLCTIGQNPNWYKHNGEYYEGSSKNDPTTPLLGINPGEMKSKGDLYSHFH